MIEKYFKYIICLNEIKLYEHSNICFVITKGHIRSYREYNNKQPNRLYVYEYSI